MSMETKHLIEKIQKEYQQLGEGAKRLSEQVRKFDGDLATKIKKVGESSGEVVTHIEKRIDKR